MREQTESEQKEMEDLSHNTSIITLDANISASLTTM